VKNYLLHLDFFLIKMIFLQKNNKPVKAIILGKILGYFCLISKRLSIAAFMVSYKAVPPYGYYPSTNKMNDSKSSVNSFIFLKVELNVNN